MVAKLPAAYRTAPSWVGHRLAELVDRTLDPPAGRSAPVLAPAAILTAAHTWQHYPPVVAAIATHKHIDALRHVISLLAADVAAGSCGDCGHHHREDPAGTCPCCDPTRNAGHAAGDPDDLENPDVTSTALPSVGDLESDPSLRLADLFALADQEVEFCRRCDRADDTVAVRHGRLRHPTPLCQVCWSGAPAA